MAGDKKKKTEKTVSTAKTAKAKPVKAKTAKEKAVKAKTEKTKAEKVKTEKAAASKTAKTSTAARTSVKKPAPKTGSVKRAAPRKDWPVFTQKMEQSLVEQKEELIENLIANNKDFKEIVEGMDPKDFADIASDDIDRKMIEALGSQELKRLKLIESALTRIRQGKYGYCIKCEKRIPNDRLEAIPYALMCVSCKSEEERRNR